MTKTKTQNTQGRACFDDLHMILLSGASQRDSGYVLPAPESVRDNEEGIKRALDDLLELGLIERAEVTVLDQVWRVEDDVRVGLMISSEGLALIDEGGEGQGAEDAGAGKGDVQTPSQTPLKGRSGTKQALLIDLLTQEQGATLDEIVAATGWLPHTARAVISGLRKKGMTVSCVRTDGVSQYRSGEAA